MKSIPESLEKYVKDQYSDTEENPIVGRKVTFRADVRNLEQLKHEAKSSNDSHHSFNFRIDEPHGRGGTNSGLHPLGYFLIGAASCFLNQLVKAAVYMKLDLDSIEVTVVGHAKTSSHAYQASGIHEFTDFVYDIRATGSENNETLSGFLNEGENRCFVHQTLKKAIPLTSRLFLNGEQVLSHTLGPETL